MIGLVAGSYQGCSEALHSLAREAAEARARSEWRRMGARSEHEALGVFMHDVHRRWGSVLWRSWARVIRGRLPVIGLPNADFLRHGPPPAYARGRGAVGGAEPWPQMHPGVVLYVRGPACERRATAAGWQVPAEPTMPRLNSQDPSDFKDSCRRRGVVRWKPPPTARVAPRTWRSRR